MALEIRVFDMHHHYITLRPSASCGLLVVAFVLAGIRTGAFGAEAADVPAALTRPVPTSVDDLRVIQEHVVKVAGIAQECVVGVQLGQARASGVVVSADGYVLTAAHVAGRPGREVLLFFSNRRIVRGRTLGLNPDIDGALIKIADSGPWPFAPIASETELPKQGDWCIASGHPGGFLPDRSPPVRLGRVIQSDRYVLRTDCLIAGGDSGGPLFDLQGRVIGIHSRIADSATVNLHVPATTYNATWDLLTAGRISRQSQFLAQFDADQDGVIEPEEIPTGVYRRVYDRLAKRFEFQANEPQPMETLRQTIGLKIAQDVGFDPRLTFSSDRILSGQYRRSELLDEGHFTRGHGVRAAFQNVVSTARDSTVEVRRDGEYVCLGTVVSTDGLILTKASELQLASGATPVITCRLPDGRKLTATTQTTSDAFDLALIKVDAQQLTPVKWKSARALKPGEWLATVGTNASPVSIGIVSVNARRIPRDRGVMGIQGEDRNGRATVIAVIPDSGAEDAGVRVNDVVTGVNDQVVVSFRQVQQAVQSHRVGDVIRIRVLRDGKDTEYPVRLGMRENVFNPDNHKLSGALSHRRDDFPSALQHDSLLLPTECGGPVVNLDGDVIGINIARSERTVSLLVPTETIQQTFGQLRISL